MLFEVLAAFIIGFSIIWFYYCLKTFIYLRKFPSPKTWSIFGNAINDKNLKDYLQVISKQLQKLNTNTMRVRLGFQACLVSKDPILLEKILTSSTNVYKKHVYLDSWPGNGLFSTIGDYWRQSQKIISPKNDFQMLDQFVINFNDNGLIMINKIKSNMGNLSIEVFEYICLCILDINCKSALGVSLNTQSMESSEYVRFIEIISEIIHDRMIFPWYGCSWLLKLSPLYRKQNKYLNSIHTHIDLVIKTRKEEFKVDLKEKKKSDFCGNKQKSFIDQLLQSTINERPLSDRKLKDEIMTLILADYNTTVWALSFTLYLLAHHPNSQQKAFKEIVQIFEKDAERPCTITDTHKMTYMEMVVKASMKLYPPGSYLSTILHQDCKHEGTVIPKNTPILFLVNDIQFGADHSINPKLFNPDRFSANNYNESKNISFDVLGTGLRNCKQEFVMLEMKFILSWVLRHFELVPAVPEHKIELRSSFALTAVNGIKIGFIQRKYPE